MRTPAALSTGVLTVGRTLEPPLVLCVIVALSAALGLLNRMAAKLPLLHQIPYSSRAPV